MSENSSVFYVPHRLAAYHVNMHGRLTLPMTLNLMLDSAAAHADSNGFGFEAVSRLQKAWVLSRFKLEMFRYPVYGQHIRIKTWVRSAEGFFSERDYQILDEKDRVLGGALSSWAAIDLQTRRPTRVENIPREMDTHPEMRGLESELGKLPECKSAEANWANEVNFTDLDLNGHVTTVKYIDWILASYPYEFLSKHMANKLEVQFMKETFRGYQVAVFGQEEDSLTRLHNIRRLDEKNTELSRARLSWQAI